MNPASVTPLLRILLVEDDRYDAELTISQLRSAGYDFEVITVDNEQDFVTHLGNVPVDVILWDFHLPAFSGTEALSIAQKQCPDIPFIFVSGVLGEETAIDTMKQGATDYVLKQRIDRLPHTVARALRETEDRRQRIEIERALQKTETHFRLLVNALRDYAVIALDADGKIQTWNNAAKEIFGYDEQEVAGHPLDLFFCDADLAANIPQMQFDAAARDGSCTDDRSLWRKDGGRFYSSGVVTAIRSETGALLGFSKIVRDNTERRLAHENTYFLANHDSLTGLANRANFHGRLREALGNANRDKNQVALLLRDLDRFKSINDSLGHHVGDLLLIEVARRLSACVRETDSVARLGGDEFVVIQTRVGDPDNIRKLA